eukprot:316358-Chlamydomonas_euryale.AAC.3
MHTCCTTLCTVHFIGLSQSFAPLRSRMVAAAQVFGPWTTSINLSPYKVCQARVFIMLGEEYKFNAFGFPRDDAWPSLSGRRGRRPSGLVAQNPAECADFANICFRAFREVLLGCDAGAAQQTHPQSFS